ncbi:hypothetical protein KPH14_004838 [Odynerus spinipes]|uniref:Protein kinase C-binding protein NELL1 n=1 Tax=Odynerus spinipes TaxID=1348599 RepID=A0AAD9RNS7_9HYME|nr:hypothetical protein KPH14_004838 [Odynerus spinipes]
MYYGPVIDRTGSSCSASDHHRLQRRQRDHHHRPRHPRHPLHRHPLHRSHLSHPPPPGLRLLPSLCPTRPEDLVDQEDLDAKEEEEKQQQQQQQQTAASSYVLLLSSVSGGPPPAASSCHAARRPGRRRRDGGHAVRIFLVATAAAFLALAVSPVSGTSNKKEEETAVAASVGVTEENGVLGARSKPGSDPGGGIDLLAALQLHNTTRQGVTQVPGLVRLKAAYYLQGEERELRLSEASFKRAAALLRRVPEFTIAAALRQEEANSGTIVAFSHGNNRYLELQSSGRKDELRLHYVSRRDGSVHVEAFPFRLADGAWHRVALSISGSQVELLVDCHPLYRRLLRPGPPDTNFTLPQLQLWIGQRNARHFLFKGALQDVKVVPGPHGYLSQCPQLDSSCPTCGQFSMLQNTVEQLMHNLNELTRRLAAAEGRINKVEECECQKSCRANGTVHEDGATWEKGCQQCSCVHGEIECRPTPCAPVTCKNPVIPQGQCCPICLKQCYLHGVIYDHGEKVSPKQCVECDCYDGSFTCQRFDTETRCPPLPCPPSEQISVAEECCKFCPGRKIRKDGYAGDGHTCKPICNQTCQNGGECVAPGRCSCRRGYIGNSCELDLDECASDLHRCHQSSTCFNMPGWYYCRCKPGYRSALHDSTQGTQCLDIDECNDHTIERRHTCHPSAKCVNTEGGYACACPREENNTEEECRLSCWFEDREVANGETLAPAGNPCRRCTCKDGVITCRDPICDCSAPGSRKDKCCPQCDPAASCRHQELHNLVFRSGERWIYQCQTCECLYGEIDCWQMECPPVTCSNPVTEDGDCCPRCEDDPCARDVSLNATSLSVPTRPRPCSYAGIIHDSGSSWQDPHDKCTTCECKDGQLCCSYDYGCAGDLGDEQQQRATVGVPESLVQHLSDASRWSLVEGTQEAAIPAVTRAYVESISSSSSSYSSPSSSPSVSLSSSSAGASGSSNGGGGTPGPGRKAYLGSPRQLVQSRDDRRGRVVERKEQHQRRVSATISTASTTTTTAARSQQASTMSRGSTSPSTTSPTKIGPSSISSSSSTRVAKDRKDLGDAATTRTTRSAASSTVTLLVPSSSTIDELSTFATKTAASKRSTEAAATSSSAAAAAAAAAAATDAALLRNDATAGVASATGKKAAGDVGSAQYLGLIRV